MPTPRQITRIACVGEVMIELITGEGNAAEIGVAGDTYNTAVYLRRLLAQRSDVTVSYVTALGDDRMSHRILDHMRAHQLDTARVGRIAGSAPGLYAIETDASGERQFSYWREQAAARQLFQPESGIRLDDLMDFDLVFFSGISLAILPDQVRGAMLEALKAYRDRGGEVAFDSNYRPRLWRDPNTARSTVEAAWAAASIGLPSCDDEQALFADADAEAVRARLNALGLTNGALKRGADGPLPLSGALEGEASFDAAPVVRDTTAAGDSFNAGWLAAFCQGCSPNQCLQVGHNLASQVVQAHGAVVPTEPVL